MQWKPSETDTHMGGYKDIVVTLSEVFVGCFQGFEQHRLVTHDENIGVF